LGGQLTKNTAVEHYPIIPAEGELHGYQLSPSDSLRLSKSAVIIGLNENSEPWLNDWIIANDRTTDAVWINAKSESISHPWMNPNVAKEMVKKLYEALNCPKFDFGS
jgi:ABC-type Zn uptake system ZnuABC Zn-binding protein ZnuA